jgi:hypothetical protein
MRFPGLSLGWLAAPCGVMLRRILKERIGDLKVMAFGDSRCVANPCRDYVQRVIRGKLGLAVYYHNPLLQKTLRQFGPVQIGFVFSNRIQTRPAFLCSFRPFCL